MLELLYIIVMMLFLFGITIFVHEWGHFIVAKKCGLVIESFSIGMGPALWKKEKDGIVYKIGAFPIGGYVALPQLDPAGMEKVQGDNSSGQEDLPEISPWKKIAVALAGPLCNILFAIPLAFLVTLSEPPPAHTAIGVMDESSPAYAEGLRAGDVIMAVNGTPVEDWYGIMSEDLLTTDHGTVELQVQSGDEILTYTLPSESTLSNMAPAMLPLLAQISAREAAGEAGLKTGDLITGIDGKPIRWWHELSNTLQDYDGQEIDMDLLRNEKPMRIKITPRYNEEVERVLIGVTPGDPGMLAWSMTGSPWEQMKSDAMKIVRLLKALTTSGESKSAAKALGGPIAIFTMIWFSLKLGLLYAIGLIRFININLAVLNLLPIPVLDGGHICFALWEGITRRKVPPKMVALLVNIFAILLITAMLFLSWRDIDRNWNVSRFFEKSSPVTEQVDPVPDGDE